MKKQTALVALTQAADGLREADARADSAMDALAICRDENFTTSTAG